MSDQTNNETSLALREVCHAMMLRLKNSVDHIADAHQWRWILVACDLDGGDLFSNGSSGPVVTLGMPWLSAECSIRWLGPRVFFWPQGIPARRRVSIVSSRLKQRLDEESWWFDLLRTAVLRTDPTLDLLCAVTETAPHHFVCRAAELFGRSLLEFHLDSHQQPCNEDALTKWLIHAANGKAWDSSAGLTDDDLVAEPSIVECYEQGKHWSVFVSPQMKIAFEATDSELPNQPIGDRILFAAGNRLQVLRARANGAIQALLSQHVQDAQRWESIVMLASQSSGEIPEIVINSTGCIVPWILKSDATETESIAITTDSIATDDRMSVSDSTTRISTPLTQPDEWLLHWTRSTVGPWPDQDEQEFDDELILGCHSSDRSALATVLRIVNEGKLWASSEAIRGGHRVVSFTEVPLHEFRKRRTYRRHRRRYDFEPWGIAIRRDVLTCAGARPVIYGDEETWHQILDQDQPFFQNIGTGEGWTQDEREWRIRDHVQLKELPPSAVIVFVDSDSARRIVQKQTDWQVVVVPDGNHIHR